MSKIYRSFEHGFIDVLSLVAVVFLITSVITGVVAVSKENANFDTQSKAACTDYSFQCCTSGSGGIGNQICVQGKWQTCSACTGASSCNAGNCKYPTSTPKPTNTPAPTSAPPSSSCTDYTYRCCNNNSGQQVCVQGKWQTCSACNSGYTCKAGSCLAPSPTPTKYPTPTLTPTPITYTCTGTCLPNGEDCYQKNTALTCRSGLCCIQLTDPHATPFPTPTPILAGRCEGDGYALCPKASQTCSGGSGQIISKYSTAINYCCAGSCQGPTPKPTPAPTPTPTSQSTCSGQCVSMPACGQVHMVFAPGSCTSTDQVCCSSPPTSAPTPIPTSPPSCNSTRSGFTSLFLSCATTPTCNATTGVWVCPRSCDSSKSQYSSLFLSCATTPTCNATTGIWTCPPPTLKGIGEKCTSSVDCKSGYCYADSQETPNAAAGISLGGSLSSLSLTTTPSTTPTCHESSLASVNQQTQQFNTTAATAWTVAGVGSLTGIALAPAITSAIAGITALNTVSGAGLATLPLAATTYVAVNAPYWLTPALTVAGTIPGLISSTKCNLFPSSCTAQDQATTFYTGAGIQQLLDQQMVQNLGQQQYLNNLQDHIRQNISNSSYYVSPSEAQNIADYFTNNGGFSNPSFRKYTAGTHVSAASLELNGQAYMVKKVDLMADVDRYINSVQQAETLITQNGLVNNMAPTTFVDANGTTYAVQKFISGDTYYLNGTLKAQEAVSLLKNNGLFITDPKGNIVYSAGGPVIIDTEGVSTLENLSAAAKIYGTSNEYLDPYFNFWLK